MKLHEEIEIDYMMKILSEVLKADKRYRKDNIFNPVFEFFKPDVKKEICMGMITGSQARRLLT